MKSLNKGLYYLLSISLAFGSINPLKLGQISEQVIDQQGLSPIIFLCCICISLFDKNVRKVISSGHKTILEHHYFNLAFNNVSIFVDAVRAD